MSVLRQPAEESADLYPGFVVCDDRVAGSITAGRSCLPVWAFIGTLVRDGWGEAHEAWQIKTTTGLTKERLSDLLHDLFQARGELGRLLLVLAAAHREVDGETAPAWQDQPELCAHVKAQLRRCLEVLETEDKPL
jgi:hypothetical protein